MIDGSIDWFSSVYLSENISGSRYGMPFTATYMIIENVTPAVMIADSTRSRNIMNDPGEFRYSRSLFLSFSIFVILSGASYDLSLLLLLRRETHRFIMSMKTKRTTAVATSASL